MAKIEDITAMIPLEDKVEIHTFQLFGCTINMCEHDNVSGYEK